MADPTSSSSLVNNYSSSLGEITHAVLQLVHWKEPKKTAAAFSGSLLVLVSVATLSIISVVSYSLLTCLCVTITFRVYKSVIQAVQKSDEGHPFRSLLDRDISVSSEWIRSLAGQSLVHVNCFISQTRRLMLVEDLVDSMKVRLIYCIFATIRQTFAISQHARHPWMQAHYSVNQKYVDVILKLQEEFEHRFADFKTHRARFQMFADPFSFDVQDAPPVLQMELIDLQCNSELKAKFREVSGKADKLGQFLRELTPSFPELSRMFKRTVCLFGSTYLCEKLFSTLNFNKSKYRSRLTD
eukprot:XP_003972313.1 PREDICTED: reticulon-3-like [Takifugu rubripes]